MAEERLQKIIARAGIASRRAAEELILEGRVKVNGRVVTKLGSKADPDHDHINVGRKAVRKPGMHHYFVAFKPRSMITSLSDPQNRPTVTDLLKQARIKTRVYPVGRLDWDADGLLLLTDDGDLAHQVMHPRTHLQKLYRVKVAGQPSDRTLARARRGVHLDARTRSLPAEVEVESIGPNTSWLRVTLVEGRKNQLKRMFERLGHPVRRIRRLAIGPLSLGRLRVGEVRALRPHEVERLRRAVAGSRKDGASGRPQKRKGAARGASKSRGKRGSKSARA